MRSALLAASLALAGCYLPEPGAGDDAGAGGHGGGGDVLPGVVVGPGGDACAVPAVTARRCWGCHGPAPVAPMALMTASDFAAPAPSSPSRSTAQVTWARLTDAVNPMPPSGPLSAEELGHFAAWADAGFSLDGCDAGAFPDAGPTPDAGPPLDAGPAGDGLPCDVEALLAFNCRTCHGSRPSAPMPLLSYAHLTAPARTEPTTTVGALSVSRMRNAARPMPPAGVLPAAQVDVLAAWVSRGMPRGTCATPVDAGVNPFDVAPMCSSGTYYPATGGREGPSMYPGRACLTCHQQVNAREGEEKAPGGFGGTVYPTAREPDRCNGLPGGATVVLTGANGAVLRLPVNAVGNFNADLRDAAALTRPFRARVEYQGRVRHMQTPQMSGDCNSCHTQLGANGAPGRILAP